MLRAILCAVCFFVGISQATAQVQISFRTHAIGKQRITDIFAEEPLTPPRQAGAEAKAKGDSAVVTLIARDWKSGVMFKDGDGNAWRLVYGPILPSSPPQLDGALTHASDGRVLFLTNGGTLFIRIGK
jgi:hypothetical protein